MCKETPTGQVAATTMDPLERSGSAASSRHVFTPEVKRELQACLRTHEGAISAAQGYADRMISKMVKASHGRGVTLGSRTGAWHQSAATGDSSSMDDCCDVMCLSDDIDSSFVADARRQPAAHGPRKNAKHVKGAWKPSALEAVRQQISPNLTEQVRTDVPRV